MAGCGGNPAWLPSTGGHTRPPKIIKDLEQLRRFVPQVSCFFVTVLACPRKVTQRRAPGENPLRHARSSSVHFGNSPCGLRHPRGAGSPKCFTLGLGRLPRFSHGLYPKPCTSLERPYEISGAPVLA